MNYRSTRNSSLKVTSAHAITKGLSDEGGLFVPESIPQFTKDEILAMCDKSYADRAYDIFSRLLTDFTPEDGDNDAETLRLRGEFKKIVGSIINEHLDPDNKLKIYNMLGQYNGDGLVYYYTNYDAIKAEIDKLSGYLNGLLEEEEALKIMVSAAGFPEYAEKITDLGGTLDEAKAALSAPNPAIDLRDTTKVTALVNALTLEGEAGTAKDVAAPYLDDNAPHTVNAKGYKGITVTVKKGETGLAVSEQWTIEHVLTEDDIDALKAKVNAKIA
jgi:hypothetical protein